MNAAAPAKPSAAAPSRPPPGEPDEPQSPAAQPKPTAAPAQFASGGWAVQVGSFSQADNADRLRAQLERTGYTAFVSRAVTDAGTMHRVRVGPVEDKAAADRLHARLRTAGQQGRVVSLED
jgi:cell division septation protein DedD